MANKAVIITFDEGTSQADVDKTVEAIEIWLHNNDVTAIIDVGTDMGYTLAEGKGQGDDATLGS
jgi:hypothetical protein